MIPLVIELVKYAPTLIKGGMEIIDAAQDMWVTLTAEEPPTPEQQAEFDAALEAAHHALQES
jgi:hypothetical protein